MLLKLRLVNFRSFRDFTISFDSGVYLVGPNNAGKSTILTALRTADVLLRSARSRKPSLSVEHGGRKLVAYPLVLNDFPALQESVRHEFHNGNESRFELTWKSKAKLVAVWPAESEDGEFQEGFFYLERSPGIQVRDTNGVRNAFPLLGIIPPLSPIEHSEGVRDDRYVRSSVTTRLSSRHFRNQLRILRAGGEFEEFTTYMCEWLDGVELSNFDNHYDGKEMILDVYYTEQGSNVPKELVWAGDGIQVWLQILYHTYRTRSLDTLILDEPEVYLHADLQRRLVHLLEATGRQVIVATHSAEMITEAEPKLVTLVEKSRKFARRADDTAQLEILTKALGTAFNLRLARALRSNVALFVEGKDMVVLRRLAQVLEMNSIVTERGITVIPLEGYSRSVQVAPFTWLCKELLPEAIKVFVVLDRDYRSDGVISSIEQEFLTNGIVGHIWRRKELESYLLTPEPIARITGVALEVIEQILDEVSSEMEGYVFGQMLSERIQMHKGSGTDVSVVTTEFKREFDIAWRDSRYRLYACPAKEVFSDLNRRLQGMKARAVTVRALANAHRPYEIPTELVRVLRKVEEEAQAQRQ
jgi:energy-coupling factor transporter ATP-binding protein EcfA2